MDGDGAAITTGAKIDALRQIDQYWTIEKVSLHSSDGVNNTHTSVSIQIRKTTDIDDTDANIESGASSLVIAGSSTETVSIDAPKSGTVYTQAGADVTSASTLVPGDFIFPKLTANGSSATKLHVYIELKATTT